MPDNVRAALSCSVIEGLPDVLSVSGTERLSRSFHYVIRAELPDLDIANAPAANVHLVLTDEVGDERHVSGVLDRVVVDGQPDPGLVRASLHVRPLHYMLRYRHGFRIFQEMTVQQIVTQVFDDAGIDAALVRWDIQGSYETRVYTVQYDEDEWSFVCRLLEDEGIWFAFEHDAAGAVMVIGDTSDRVEPLSQATLAFRFFAQPDQVAGTGFAYNWRRGRSLVEGKVSLRDYDGLRPSLDLNAENESDEPHAREHYEYPGGYEVAGEGTRRAEARLQELSSRRRTATGETDTLTIQPGRRFELLDHPSALGEHVVTGIDMHLSIRPEVTDSERAEAREHRFRFTCVPKDQIFRPARVTPVPRIYGLQTARVCGPSGEEIYCDEHGRVKVQFHWDEEGQSDENTTVWIRSTHPHTTGSVTVPRIGWEVMVQFYEGDPDRPVVLGHLFNPHHQPPVDLPAQKTMTIHQSSASPGAGCINEVTFNDNAGSQKVAINAGKDQTLNTVENKMMQTSANIERTVAVNRTFDIGADDTISLEAGHTHSVGVDQTLDVGGNRTTKASNDTTEDITGSMTLSVGGLENMMIGNPIDAVISIIQSEAIAAAEGVAAQAADRVQGALLAPIAPALDAVNGALGEASAYVGPAGAILGADNPAVALYGDALGAMSEATTPPDIASMAGGMANAVASGAAGAAADALAAAGIGGGGSGNWGTTVNGDVTEDIGALSTVNSAYGISINVGGNLTETIGAARAHIAKGGSSEKMASKTETVGVYMVQASDSVAISANGALTINVASVKMDLGGSYACKAGGIAAVTAGTVMLDAKQAVTLKCGPAEVVVGKSGILCKGATSVTIKGSSAIELKPAAIAPGM